MSADLRRTFGDSIPEHYDRCLGPAWFGAFSAELARRLTPDPGGDVLEIACGTGLMTRPLRERLARQRALVATDLSPAMLDYARGKNADLDGIRWETADAANLPYGDAAFAAVLCAFGVMFVPDRRAAFDQARRVLQPGGRFIFNVWDRIEENTCPRVYAEVIESLFPGDDEMRFRIPYDMHDEGLLRELLAGSRFAVGKMEKVRLPVQGKPLDIATGQVRGTPRGSLLAKRGVDPQAVIEKVARTLEESAGRGGEFRATSQAIAIEAVAI